MKGKIIFFSTTIVIYLFIGLIAGVPSTETNVVGSVNELYPIAEFVSAGDQITNIDGIAINDWNDLTKALDNKYNETVTITSVPIYYLEPNTIISAEDEQRKVNCYYIINKISLPLDYKGTMSITAIKVPERVY